MQATSTCDTVVPAYGDTAGRPPVNPDHAPVQLSGAGNVTARISLCGAGRTLIRKMTGTITVPADYILFRDAFLIHFSFFVPFLSPFSVFGHFVTLETRMVGRFLRENIVFNTIWQVIIVLVSK